MNDKFIVLTTGRDNPRPIIIGVSNIASIRESTTGPDTIIVLNFESKEHNCSTIIVSETLEQIKEMLGI